MDPLNDHNSFDPLNVSFVTIAVAAAAIGIRDIDASGTCSTGERYTGAGVIIPVDLFIVSPLLPPCIDILLLTPYNQLWEIFSTFLFLVDCINK